MEAGPTVLRKGLLSSAFKAQRVGEKLALKQAGRNERLDTLPLDMARKQSKREEGRPDLGAGTLSTECMAEIRQILAQRESARSSIFGCSPPARSHNPLAATFRCAPKAPTAEVGSSTCVRPHA